MGRWMGTGITWGYLTSMPPVFTTCICPGLRPFPGPVSGKWTPGVISARIALEMFGSAQVETDTFLRTLGWRVTAGGRMGTN
jgi:hypothetical protein